LEAAVSSRRKKQAAQKAGGAMTDFQIKLPA
jgi:hypothetical protein